MQPQLPGDALNADFGEALAVAFFHLVSFTSFFLEYNNFIAFLMAEYLGVNFCLQGGFAQLYFAIAINEVYLVKINLVALFGL